MTDIHVSDIEYTEPEFDDGEIQRIVIEAYDLALGRFPDEQGLRDHCDFIKSGKIDVGMLYRALLQSEEARDLVDTRAKLVSTAGTSTKSRAMDGRLVAEEIKARAINFFDIQDLLNFLHHHNSVTGIQRVICGIVLTILELPDQDRATYFAMIGERQGEVLVFDERSLFEVVNLAMDGGSDQAYLRELVIGLKKRAQPFEIKPGDLYFIGGAYWIVPDFGRKLNLLRARGAKVATYIYDLIPITAPQWVTDETRLAVTDRAIDIFLLSDFFLTISEFVKSELARLLSDEFAVSKSITSVPLPHVLPTRTAPERPIDPRMLNIGSFVLCVCTLEGRKNHMLLFRIWSALIRSLGYDNVPTLVLVGKWGWNIDRFRQACIDSNYLNGKIIIFENIGDSDLMYLYRKCDFTIFPSFVEGWGLPVGESLSLGKLCVASNSSSIPEVGTTYCEYIDPLDFSGSLRVVKQLVTDEALLSEKTRNVQNFEARTWSGYVNDLLAQISANRAGEEEVHDGFLVHQLQPGRKYSISGASLVKDDTLNWSDKALKFCLSEGWDVLEDWGSWSNQQDAVLDFRCSATSKIVMHLELRSPRAIHGGAPVSLFMNGRLLSRHTLSPNAKWISVKIDLNGDSHCKLRLRSDFYPVIEPNRKLYAGVSGVAYVDAVSNLEHESLIEFGTMLNA